MRDISVVIPTVDRHPRRDYLSETLANLSRAGVWQSPRLHSAHIIDTGVVIDGIEAWPDRALSSRDSMVIQVHRTETRRLPTLNAAAALRAGANGIGVRFVVFVEDDVDVCADFLCGVGAWLDRNARSDRPVYCFSGDHSSISHAADAGVTFWDYPVTHFWGTQCMALAVNEAHDLADWWEAHPLFQHKDGREDTAYDLEMHRWAEARGYQNFLASAPSYVSHLGVESFINPTRDWHPQFSSWPGRDWSYRQQQMGVSR